MLLSNRIVRLAVDAAALHGVDRDELVGALGVDGAHALADGGLLEWGSVVALFDRLSRLVGHDHEVLQAIGRDMQHAKSPDVVRDVARGLLTPRSLYRFVDLWIAPGFAHLRLFMRFVTDRRMQLHATIPEPHAPCEPFFVVLASRLTCLPELLGLPPSRVVERRITARTADLVLELPEAQTLRRRAMRFGRALLSRGTMRDALEQHRHSMEESIDALQRARYELRVLLERLPDLVVVHRGGRIVWVNDAFVRTLGYARREDLAGRRVLDVVAARSQAGVVARGLENDAPGPLLKELTLLSRTGDEIIVEAARSQPVVFDGLPARMTVGRDVTERARMQQKLIVADRLASIGLLAAGVAHEVNNPLAYVLNNIEIARRVAGLPAEAELSRNVLDVALEGVDRIRTIVRDLLMLSRGADGPSDPTDVRSVVESTLALAAREVERTARLVIELGPAPLVRASGPRVAQILLNLVANALEAMHELPREDSVLGIVVGYSEDGRFLLEVSDTGHGIGPADLGRVFEPFFTTKPAGKGTGLGLAIAQRLVVEAGGEILVASEVGRGTTFRVLFPAVGPAARIDAGALAANG